MAAARLRNVDLKLFIKYLESEGLSCIREKGGHKIFSRKDLLRPVVLQSHIDPVPEFIVKNTLKNIGKTKEDFNSWIEN